MKKRRRIDGEREKRVKMLEEMEEGEKNEVGVAPPSGRDVWGGDDEEVSIPRPRSCSHADGVMMCSHQKPSANS